ncbi:MAG TPA: hypothetical protein ENI45_05315, partial [Thermoplasmatales archaeon]|nr:hypothetical protein [Thermoplasmatales archaeon]
MRKKTILVVCIAFIAATAIFLCENAYSVEEKEPYRLVKITVDLSSFEGDPQQIVDDIRNLLPKEYSSGGEWVLPIKTVDITTGEVSCQYPIPVKEWDVQKI